MATKKTTTKAKTPNKKTSDRIKEKAKENNNKKGMFESLRNAFGLISAGTGVFVALLFLAGRSFASGYFGAMNIPNYQVGFSLWEYGEVAWLPTILYPAIVFGISGLLYGFFLIVWSWIWSIVVVAWNWIWSKISPLYNIVINWIRKRITDHLPQVNFPEISLDAKQLFALSRYSLLVIVSVYFVYITLDVVKTFGSSSGQNYALHNAPVIELASTSPISIDNGNVINSQVGGQQVQYYEYQGFHMLTFNNGKYYLFKDIDPVSCKPIQVFVINDNENLQVRILPPVSLAGKCHNDQVKQETPTPTVFPTALP